MLTLKESTNYIVRYMVLMGFLDPLTALILVGKIVQKHGLDLIKGKRILPYCSGGYL